MLYLVQIAHSNGCTNNKGTIRGEFSLCTHKIANVGLGFTPTATSSVAQQQRRLWLANIVRELGQRMLHSTICLQTTHMLCYGSIRRRITELHFALFLQRYMCPLVAGDVKVCEQGDRSRFKADRADYRKHPPDKDRKCPLIAKMPYVGPP